MIHFGCLSSVFANQTLGFNIVCMLHIQYIYNYIYEYNFEAKWHMITNNNILELTYFWGIFLQFIVSPNYLPMFFFLGFQRESQTTNDLGKLQRSHQPGIVYIARETTKHDGTSFSWWKTFMYVYPDLVRFDDCCWSDEYLEISGFFGVLWISNLP